MFFCGLVAMAASGAELVALDSPAGSNTSLSRLTTDAAGGVHLSWVETDEERSALYVATLAQRGWSAPSLIASGHDWFVNWADFPVLSVNDQGMTAHWLRKSSEGTYDYDVVATFLDSPTGTWSKGVVVHKDGVSAEHGFVSMLPMPDERTFITWLDGRNTGSSGHGHDATGHGGGGGMTLRGGVFSNVGATVSEWELDGLVCDCCQTSAAMAAAGPVVVYRDRSDAEIRDIYITRFVDGAWSEPAPVFSDGWEIAGCPVNGPSVAARDNDVAVAWFSAKDNHPKVSLSISADGGATFGDPVTIQAGETNGRVGIAMLASGRIAVSWLVVDGPDAKLKVGVFDGDGRKLDEVVVAETKSSRRSGFPVITSRGDDVYVTWTDVAESRSVRVARVSFD